MKFAASITILFLALSSLLNGCSARVAVQELDPKQTTIDGVPFRIKERYVMEVYQLTDKGYEKIGEQLATLPNQKRVYLLQHFGKAFANSNTKFTLRGDGTLSSVSLSSTNTGPDALTAVGDQLTSISQKVKDLHTAKEDKKKQSETNLETTETGEVAYLTAYNAATLAQAQLDELSKDATDATRLAKKNEVTLLKLQANIAARRANLPRPFPDVSL